jgi:hypothetical protein
MSDDKKNKENERNFEADGFLFPLQNCPLCGEKISALPGTRDAICQNCGFKDPCCE